MSNLIADGFFGLAVQRAYLNVWPLMDRALIWAAVLSDNSGRLSAALDAQDMERLADPLVDGVRRDAELGRDLLR
jgi:hypothetical protein